MNINYARKLQQVTFMYAKSKKKKKKKQRKINNVYDHTIRKKHIANKGPPGQLLTGFT